MNQALCAHMNNKRKMKKKTKKTSPFKNNARLQKIFRELVPSFILDWQNDISRMCEFDAHFFNA
jgi:hypothetical protein